MKYSHSVFVVLKDLAGESPLPVTIGGECMVPAIESGERLEVRAARFYRPGDVVVVRGDGGQLVAHRLLLIYRRRGQWKALTQADKARSADVSVAVEHILGRIEAPDAVTITMRVRSLCQGLSTLFGRLAKRAALG